MMLVELFYVEGCEKCSDNRGTLKHAAEQTIPELVWREVNVLDELDYAVKLGVLNIPAMAINKELVFASLPSTTQLVKALHQRSEKILSDGH